MKAYYPWSNDVIPFEKFPNEVLHKVKIDDSSSLSSSDNTSTSSILQEELINKCLMGVRIDVGQYNSMVCKNDVKAVISQYKGLVFSELDKNVSSWSVMCEKHYMYLLCKNFGVLSENYTINM